jgi:hypothetical protein
MTLLNDVRRKLGDRIETRKVSAQLANIEYQLERIAKALEVFSSAAEHELTDTAERAARKRTSQLVIGEFDVDAANAAYHENTAAKGVAPPPPDNENYQGGPT